MESKNICPNCKTNKYAELRNYDLTWGDGDIYCKKCEIKIRNWDRDW